MCNSGRCTASTQKMIIFRTGSYLHCKIPWTLLGPSIQSATFVKHQPFLGIRSNSAPSPGGRRTPSGQSRFSQHTPINIPNNFKTCLMSGQKSRCFRTSSRVTTTSPLILGQDFVITADTRVPSFHKSQEEFLSRILVLD